MGNVDSLRMAYNGMDMDPHIFMHFRSIHFVQLSFPKGSFHCEYMIAILVKGSSRNEREVDLGYGILCSV